MRQSKREIIDPDHLRAILDACDVCRVGFSDDGQPYIVPMNFGYCWTSEGLSLYFHCATEGRKLDIMRRNQRTCFEMDCRHELRSGSLACQYSMNYASIMGEGILEQVTEQKVKIDGLNCIMHHYDQKENWSFDDKVLDKTVVLTLRVKQMTGKQLNKEAPHE